MKKSIVNELVSQVHKLEKENISKDELLNILKNYVGKERKLMKTVFTDGNESYNGAYFDYYYNLKFGDKPLHALPDLNEAVFVKFKNRRGIITQYYGCFRKDTKGLYFETIYKDQFFNIVNIIQWNYADEKFVSNFNMILKGLRLFNFDDYDLVKRFINIYKKYSDTGLAMNNNIGFYMTKEVKVESSLDALEYLSDYYKTGSNETLVNSSIWLYDGILSDPDYNYQNLRGRSPLLRLFGLGNPEIPKKPNYLKEEDVIKLEENFDKHYNKNHVSIFKIK